MARAQNPEQGKLIISIIYSSMDALADALRVLERKFGRVDMETIEIETAEAEFYREEMGERLERRFFSFVKNVERDSLVEIKAACARIEPQFADRVGDHIFRTANIDPGIISPENLVMTSHRNMNHRVYMKDGVYSEVTLIYSQEQYMRLPWTSPDFYHDEAIDFFSRTRAAFELLQPVEHISG